MNKEYLKRNADTGEFEMCLCGNDELTDGFYPCDEQGNEVQPDDRWNEKLYVCFRCGRIVDQFTGEIVGQSIENAIRL